MQYVIIFFDKSKVWINETQYQHIVENWVTGNVKFKLNGSVYSSSQISKILTKGEFEQEYPEFKSTEDKYPSLEILREQQGVGYNGVIKKATNKGLLSLLEGFEKTGSTSNPLYQTMLARSQGKTISSTEEYRPKIFTDAEEFKQYYHSLKEGEVTDDQKSTDNRITE